MTGQTVTKVAMADLNVAEGGALLKTTGLGSCVGVTLYDRKTKLAGMAHVMLPDSSIARDANFNIAKYADTAVPELIHRLVAAGATKFRLEAKLAGGAQMFAFSSQSDAMRIGPRNVESCKRILQLHTIAIAGEDTGGSHGRTIELDSGTGKLLIRSVQFGIKEL
ncbi:chemotaxis protein CheD [Paenibacillus sp. IB182496]|uniref:Probable chemoreceptor glutamine deamidase CheD n=1 Tax=Paenibacillus sabuli TaxID=2772509 RepID=A0A927GR59_9BACL|nr:chemotaxis protein CheD [Paenibacillus sabuli]MBD2845264.1 chemotaxis protein CheD [Paenibacillus sabuli]